MTNEELAARIAEFRDAEAKATPGEWQEGICDFFVQDTDGDDLVLGCVGQAGGFRSHQYSVERGRRSRMRDNNHFIVVARNKAPAIIDALVERVEALEKALSDCIDMGHSFESQCAADDAARQALGIVNAPPA